jgi:hypothetical protein
MLIPTPSLPVTAESMNYASVVFAGFAAISIGWYFVRGRKHFRGPPVPVDVSSTVKGQSQGAGVVGLPYPAFDLQSVEVWAKWAQCPQRSYEDRTFVRIVYACVVSV